MPNPYRRIFVLAALLAGRLMAELEWRDLGLLAVMVGGALAARATVLFGLLPGLGALGLVAPVGARFKTVIVWGGLRGAVTLALALAVAENEAVPPDVRHFVGVLATGFVLFTLFVSAPTLRTLLTLLGLDKLGAVERAVRDRVVALSQTNIRQEARDFAADSGLDPALVDRLSLCTADEGGAEPRLSAAERLQVGLVTLATREKALYLDSGLERAASRRLVAILSSAADHLVDQARTAGVDGYEGGALRMLAFARAFRLAHWIYRRFGFSAPLARAIADRYELLLVVQLVLRELDRAIRGPIRTLLGAETSSALAPLLEVRRVAVRDALAAIGLQYPSYAEALRSQYLQRSALRIEEADYERWRDESLISPEVHQDLARAIDARRAALDRRPQLDLGLRLSEMIRRVGPLSELPAETVNDIARLLRPRLAVPGEAIIRKGERGDAMYFVASGEVEVHLPHAAVRLGMGEFFGEMALLDARPRNADVHAVGFCHLLALGASDFARALRGYPELYARIQETAEARRAVSSSG